MSAFSWPQFLWIVTIFVGIPSAFAGVVIWGKLVAEQAAVQHDGGTGTGRLGVLTTGGLAFVLGFAACAGWLSWSAEGASPPVGAVAPTQFATWQVIACGLTVLFVCFGAAHLSRWAMAGSLSAAAGTTAGFTTAFSVSASTDTTGQSGVGVLMSVIGWGMVLGALMFVRGKLV